MAEAACEVWFYHLERTGLEITEEYQATRFAQRLEAMRKELAQFESTVSLTPSCGQLLSAADIYRTLLKEKQVQLTAALGAASTEPLGYRALLTNVNAAQTALSAAVDARKAKLCTSKS